MSQTSDKINQAYQLFFQSMVKGSLSELASAAYEILGYPVLINDDVGSNMIQIPNELIGNADWDELLETKLSPFNHYSRFWEKYISTSKEYPVYIMDGNKEKTEQLFSVLKKDRQIIGFTSFQMPNRNTLEEDKQIIRLFNTAAAQLLHMSASHADGQEESTHMTERWSRQLFNELLTMSTQTNQTFFNNVQNLSIRYTAPYAVIVIQWMENANHNDFTESLFNQLCKRFPDALCTVFEDRIVILDSQIKMHGIAVECSALLELLKKYPVNVSISSPFQDLLDIKGCYQQTLLTMQMGLQTNPKKTVYRAENFTPLQIFAAFTNHYTAKPFIHPILRKISEHDSKHGTEYLHTLRLFLFCMMNKKDAATMLHIHTNTLLYRINQIQLLFDVDFKNYYLLNTLVASFGLVIASGAHYPSYMPDVNPDAIEEP